jgi:hypothetical protein
MPKYGVINGTEITEAIIADTLEDAIQATGEQCVELPEHVGVWWRYENGNFIPFHPVTEE